MKDKIPAPKDDDEETADGVVNAEPEVAPVAKKMKPSNPRVFFDISIGGRAVGRIIFELRLDVVPSACISVSLVLTLPRNRRELSSFVCFSDSAALMTNCH